MDVSASPSPKYSIPSSLRRVRLVSNAGFHALGTRRGFCRVKVSQPARNRVVSGQWIDLVHLCSRRRPRNALDRSWPTLESRPLLVSYIGTRFLPCAFKRNVYIYMYQIWMKNLAFVFQLSNFLTHSVLCCY